MLSQSLAKLVQGQWLQGRYQLGQNGLRLRENILLRHREALALDAAPVGRDDFFGVKDHAQQFHVTEDSLEPTDGAFRLQHSEIHFPSPGLQTSQVSFLAAQWRWSYTNFFRQRRRFWKNYFYNPASVQILEKPDTHGTPRVSISCNLEGLNLDLAQPLLLEEMDVLPSQPTDSYQRLHSSLHLDSATVALLLDSVRKRQFLPSTRIALHPQLAPYQVSFAIQPSDTGDDLRELQELLTHLAEDKGLRVLNESSNDELSDLFGVPYQVILAKDSVQNGVVLIRDSVTCWYEEIHVAHIIQRLVKIYQNRDVPNSWTEIKQEFGA